MKLSLSEEEINKDWIDEKFKTEKILFLWHLHTLIQEKGSSLYYGPDKCLLCKDNIPYGSLTCNNVTYMRSLLHYVEWHGHKPSDLQIKCLDLFYKAKEQMMQTQFEMMNLQKK